MAAATKQKLLLSIAFAVSLNERQACITHSERYSHSVQ